MLNKRVIFICGRAQSGKSTLANMFQHGAGYARLSFAGPLKDMLCAMGVPYVHLHGTEEQKNAPLEILGGKSARYAMQTLGTEWRNMIDQNLWTNALLKQIQNSPANRIVVDDMRMPHEYEAFHKLGAVIIGVERPGQQGTTNSGHASETWDFKTTGMPVFQNDGTLEELWDKIQAYI